MNLLVLSASDLRSALPMGDAIEAVKSGFAALSTGQACAPLRSVVPAEPADGVTLLMGAYLPQVGTSAKVVSVFHRNRQLGKNVVNALVVVMDPNTGEPVALCDGTYLTALRTGAASGAATELLARPDARVGAIIGCGAQARTQVLAIDCVRELESIRVHGERVEDVRRFIDEMQPQVRARLDAVTTSAEAIRDVDVICTATNSKTPVFDGALLEPGTHINGVGSFTLEMQEVDTTTVRRARVFIDSLEAVVAEAGDLAIAEREGCTRREDWIELGLIAVGKAPGRQGPDEITFFKSVGHAVQDLAAAARALEVARVKGLGQELEL